MHTVFHHSRLYDGYGDKVGWILRYGGSGEDLDLSGGEISKKYLKVVKKYFPEVEFKWFKVFREKYASPIYDKSYEMHKPNYKTPLKWLYHAGIAVSYPEIRNMNTALKSGLRVTGLILKLPKNI